MEIKQAIIMSFMGKLRGCFCGYHELKTSEEKIAAMPRSREAKALNALCSS